MNSIAPRKVHSTMMVMIWIVIISLAATTVVFAINRLITTSTFLNNDALPHHESMDFGYVAHWPLTYLHIIPGLIFMICGPLQFIPMIRKRFINLHRWSGRLFVFSSFIAAISAIAISLVFPYGGLSETSATITFSLIFIFCLGRAFYHVRRKQIDQHREWMIRTFSIGLGVSTIRFLSIPFQAFSSYTFQEFFGTTFWIAFTFHLIIAEVWINWTRKLKLSNGKISSHNKAYPHP